MRVLGLAIDGRGLGHLSRLSLLARHILELRPATEIRLATESPAAWTLSDSGLPVLKLPECLHPQGALCHGRSRGALLAELLEPLLEDFRPALALLDFVVERDLLQTLRCHGCRVWVVLRRTRLQALARDPAAALVEAWLLPHAPDELPLAELPPAWRPRCHHLGSLARPLDLDRAAALRARAPRPRVLAALGGGGAREAREVASACLTAFALLRARHPTLAARLVCGPLFSAPLPEPVAGVEVVAHDPWLAEQMAAADVVVSQAGYNSVQELLASGSPGVLLPLASPGRDDQARRAAGVAGRGRARVAPAEPEPLAAAVEAILAGEGPPRLPPSPPDPGPALSALERLLPDGPSTAGGTP